MESAPHPGRQTTVLLGALVALLAAIAAGAWGLAADRGGDTHGEGDPAGQGWTAVAGGWLKVADASTRSMDHRRVPGMATMPDADPVPEGMVRIQVGVVMAADSDEVQWSASDFRLDGKGTAPLPPHTAELGDGVVPPATQVSGGLVFDVPEKARDLALSFRDGPPVPVHVDLTGQGHSDQAENTPGREHDDHGH